MNRNRQQGIVLVISLLLMVVLTLFVLSSTRLTTGNLRIVGNMQAKKLIEATAQQAVEQVLSTADLFVPNANTAVVVPAPSGMTVTVGNRPCLRWVTVKGSSEAAVGGLAETGAGVVGGSGGVAFWDTFWNVNVTVVDSITSASTEVNQGVRIRFPAGNCPV